eukprot:TRINITY_DN2110_c0_g1_i10.p3 TRINITY_DN2110_c0_g1~~TRINITY_DN2110_c0_g1_i10.p3  ORF type:complete len:174 (-),score=42.17 TRINITY_DN2110_c0_g1_i10:291-812(-)
MIMLHGNQWSAIWSATTGEHIIDGGIKLSLEFAKQQGLKNLVSFFRKQFVVENGDPKDWTEMPGYRVWLQDYTDPEMVDDIEYHLNQLRIQQQQQRESRIEENERRKQAKYNTTEDAGCEDKEQEEEEFVEVGYGVAKNGQNGATNQLGQTLSGDQDLLLSFDEENSEGKAVI